MINSKSLRGGENPSRSWGKPVGQHGSLSSSNSVLVAWCKTVFTRVDPLRKKLERTSYLLQIFYQLLAIMSRIYLTILIEPKKNALKLLYFWERGNCIQNNVIGELKSS